MLNYLIKFWPEQMIFRCAIKAAILVFIAAWISRYYAFSEQFWITTTTIVVLQTAVGLTVRQGLQRFLIITLSVLVASYAVLIINDKYIISIGAVVFLAIICYLANTTMLMRPQLAIPLVMAIVVLIVLLMPPLPMQTAHFRTLDVMVGGIIGIVGSIFILPIRADTEFRKEVVPLLQSFGEYFQAIIDYLYVREKSDNLVDKKNQLEKLWQKFPDWVYETGFVASFQAGHRHFLVRIEQIRQILFVLNYLATCNYDREMLQPLKQAMDDYVSQVQKLILSITTVLTLQQLPEGADDLADSFNRLEAAFKELVPYSLEALDLNPDSVNLANFIYELQELGKMLTVLARALR